MSLGETGRLQLEPFNGPGLVQGFFNRHGGVSQGDFSSLNVSYGVGDEDSAVLENRARLKESLQIQTLVSARQVHGHRVLVLDDDPRADCEADGYDALVTDRPVALMIQQADCQAVIFHDPVHQVIGAAHAGWRGSVENIIAKTVKSMAANFGSSPGEIKAAISPSLGPCCAEFVNYRQELPEWMHSFQGAHDHFDFWEISRQQLQDAGLLAGNIFTAGICTRCSPDYFSFRRAKITGRCATIVGLIQPP